MLNKENMLLSFNSSKYGINSIYILCIDDWNKITTELNPLWAYGVVLSMFDFHCIDRCSNPGCGSKSS